VRSQKRVSANQPLVCNPINPRTYMQIHTPTVVQGRGGGGGFDGTPLVLICCNISKPFCLQWKACDLLYKMKYILWVVALVEVCDVTKHGRHLGFYQILEIRLKQCESTILGGLTCKITRK